MRAVVELHGDSDNLPPIKIVIVQGKEDITIRVRRVFHFVGIFSMICQN